MKKVWGGVIYLIKGFFKSRFMYYIEFYNTRKRALSGVDVWAINLGGALLQGIERLYLNDQYKYYSVFRYVVGHRRMRTVITKDVDTREPLEYLKPGYGKQALGKSLSNYRAVKVEKYFKYSVFCILMVLLDSWFLVFLIGAIFTWLGIWHYYKMKRIVEEQVKYEDSAVIQKAK